jgi:hypothetical protein
LIAVACSLKKKDDEKLSATQKTGMFIRMLFSILLPPVIIIAAATFIDKTRQAYAEWYILGTCVIAVLLFRIPQYLRRKFFLIALLALGIIFTTAAYVYWRYSLWIFIPAVSFLVIFYLLVRWMDICPRCKKPLRRGSKIFYNWGAKSPGYHHWAICSFCGFSRQGSNGMVEHELADAREHYKRFNRMSSQEKSIRHILQVEDFEYEFCSWYAEKAGIGHIGYDIKEPFPSGKEPSLIDLLQWLKDEKDYTDEQINIILKREFE